MGETIRVERCQRLLIFRNCKAMAIKMADLTVAFVGDVTNSVPLAGTFVPIPKS